MSKREEFSLEDNTPAENIKISIDKILNSKTSLKKKPKTIEDKKKDLFAGFINSLEAAAVRSEMMFSQFDLNYEKYDEVFLEAIDNLLSLHFNEKQISLIEWYVYHRITPEGDMLALEAPDGSPILFEHPDHLWEYIKLIK